MIEVNFKDIKQENYKFSNLSWIT